MTGAAGALSITAVMAAGTVAVDRGLKAVVEQVLEDGESTRLLGIPVTRTSNDRGIAGSERNSGSNTALLGVGSALALGIAGAGVLFGRGRGWQGTTLAVGTSLLAGGMAANLLDRTTRDGVTDYLPSPLGTLNAGDLALASGIGISMLAAAAVALR